MTFFPQMRVGRKPVVPRSLRRCDKRHPLRTVIIHVLRVLWHTQRMARSVVSSAMVSKRP